MSGHLWRACRTLALLLEREFALLIVVLVLASSPVLTTLCTTPISIYSFSFMTSAEQTFPLFLGMLVFAQS